MTARRWMRGFFLALPLFWFRAARNESIFLASASRDLSVEAAAAGVPVCVATSGLRDHVEAHLKHCGSGASKSAAKCC